MTTPRAPFSPSLICGVRSVHIGVTQFENTIEFFKQGWGLTAANVDDGSVHLRGTGPDAYVVALQQRARTEILCVDLRALDKAAVDVLHARLAEAGASYLSAPANIAEYGGGYGFTVRDPEGRLLRILAGDHRHADTQDAIDRPRKISHVVLNTSDALTVEAFYTQMLGFKLVDRSRRITFLNCNSDHHSVALVPGSHTSLHHIAFEVPTFDALMRGVGRLREYGVNIAWGVGRHGPGDNIFSYFVGPECLPLEYTTEVQQIDETYRVGSPEDWTPQPGRMDQWGATPPPSPDMVKAERSVEFSSAPF